MKTQQIMKKTDATVNVLRVLYHGRIIELNGELQFARASYFIKRGLKLSNSQIIFKGSCYFLINVNTSVMKANENLLFSLEEVAA
jgi:hypothetical protein